MTSESLVDMLLRAAARIESAGVLPVLKLPAGELYLPTLQLILNPTIPEVRQCTLKELADLLAQPTS